MTNLNDIIKQKAREEFPYSEPLADFVKLNERQSYRCEGFEAGATFATTDPSILQAILQPFAEWLDTEGWVKTEAGHWSDYDDNRRTLEEVISKFISDTKQKEDEGV